MRNAFNGSFESETTWGISNKTQYPLMWESFLCVWDVRFDSSTEKAYQINDGLSDTLQDKRSLQRAVLNRRRHWKRIQRQLKGQQYFELDCSAGSVWLDTQSQYCGIDDTPTTTTKIKTYRINNWRILYTRGEAFNGWY